MALIAFFFFYYTFVLNNLKCRLCKYLKMAKTLIDIECQSKHLTCQAKAGIAK